MRRPPTLPFLGMGGAGGVVGILHPITLLSLLTGVRKGKGVQGRGVVTSGSGSGGTSVGLGPQKASAGDAGGRGGAGGQEGGGAGEGEGAVLGAFPAGTR